MPFEFTSPTSIEEAFDLHADGARWFAGGTDLVPEIKTELATPTRLVNLKAIPNLRGIEFRADHVWIGALTTLAEIASDKRIENEYKALAQACDLSASPQIRNVATIGGNLCQDSRCPYYRGEFHCYLKGGDICFMRDGENRNAAVIGYHDCVHVHPSDPACALVALNAEIVAKGSESRRPLSGANWGARNILAKDFFHAPQGDDRRMNVLDMGELVEAITLPLSKNSRSTFLKAMDRATWTFALASAAVRLEFDGEQIADARVVLGGVAPVPWREFRVEDTLRGKKLDQDLLSQASSSVLAEAQPLARNRYKIRLARALVKRALEQLM